MENLKRIGRFTVQRLYKTVYRFCYAVASKKKIDERKVIVYSKRAERLEGNLKAVVEKMRELYPEMNIVMDHCDNRMNASLFKQLWHIRDAKMVLLSDYFLPVYLITPRKETKFVQLWHAAGAFKKFGYSTKDTKFGPSSAYLNIVPVHTNYSHVYVSSEQVVPYYAEAFHMPATQIYPFGIPRVDLLGKERVPEASVPWYDGEMRVILIAPTYRAKAKYRESSLDWIDVLRTIAPKLADNIRLVFVPHPYTEKKEWQVLTEYPQIHVDTTYTLNEWMPVADAFVTDYSSAIFEYALFEKPLAHYVPDLVEYTNSRGLYRPIDAISDGLILTELDQLIDWLNARQKAEHYNTERMVAYNFSFTDNVSERIVHHLLEKA